MKHIFWVDLEMTGLDPETCVIIEFAGIVTDLALHPLDTYHAVVYQDPQELEKMDDWNQTTHHRTGLAQKVPTGKPLVDVEREVIDFLSPRFEDEQPVLAGNSIHQDRRFIDRYMPRLSKILHYRMLDVSSFKLIYKHKLGISFDKKESHRALDDIVESIRELAYYLTFIPGGDQPPTEISAC